MQTYCYKPQEIVTGLYINLMIFFFFLLFIPLKNVVPNVCGVYVHAEGRKCEKRHRKERRRLLCIMFFIVMHCNVL